MAMDLQNHRAGSLAISVCGAPLANYYIISHVGIVQYLYSSSHSWYYNNIMTMRLTYARKVLIIFIYKVHEGMRYNIIFKQMQSNAQIAIFRAEKVYSEYGLNGLRTMTIISYLFLVT